MNFARLLKIFVFRYRSGIEYANAAHSRYAVMPPTSLLHQGVHISLQCYFLLLFTDVTHCKC